MDIFKLVIILALIVGVMKFKQPLYTALAAGIIGASVLYGIWPSIYSYLLFLFISFP